MDKCNEIMQERIRERAYMLWQAAGGTDANREHFWLLAEQEVKNEEQEYDKTLKDSFPASDPPANSGFTS
jgi:hypothetical protein